MERSFPSREEVRAHFRDFKFQPSDWLWDDWHVGLSPERRMRYQNVILAISTFLGDLLDEWRSKGHNFAALVPLGIFSAGVVGDNRAYCPIVILSPVPGLNEGGSLNYDVLAEISRAITNSIPITRVTVVIACRTNPTA